MIACVVFVRGRLWVLNEATIQPTTIGIFAEMGLEYRLAAQRGESFYDYHARRARQIATARQAQGGPPVDTARQQVEYPPLAIAWMVLPTYFVPAELLREPITDGSFRVFEKRYATAFRRLHAAADVGIFLLLWWLARRLSINPAWAMLVYAIGGLALFPVLYDRIDLAMTMLVTVAIALLVKARRPTQWAVAFAVLAVAVNFKLVPIVLAPAFVIGAIPARRTRQIRSFLGAVTVRSAVLTALCVLCFLPFYLAAGPAALGFLEYHAERGIQVESIPANLLLLSGQVSGLTYTHGATDLVSPLAPATSIAATIATLVLLAAISIWMIAWARRLNDDAADLTIAQLHPGQIVSFATLLLLSAMATAKVFSPQYLLWLLPLAPLAGPALAVGGLFLLTCAATTVIFPYAYFNEIVRAHGYTLLPPSKIGVLLLSVRNGLFVALAIVVFNALRRYIGAFERPGARG
jgi:hypothetical protein